MLQYLSFPFRVPHSQGIHIIYIYYIYYVCTCEFAHAHTHTHTHAYAYAHGLIHIDQCNCRQLYIVGGYTPDVLLSTYIYICTRRSIQRARCQQRVLPNNTLSSCCCCCCVYVICSPTM